MKNTPELNWAMRMLARLPDIVVLTNDSFYHGDSYWYDTEFEETVYPQNGFSIYLRFNSFAAQYRFYRRFRQVKSQSGLTLPVYLHFTLNPIKKDIWLLQLKYRWRENINDQLVTYWEKFIVALSHHHDD